MNPDKSGKDPSGGKDTSGAKGPSGGKDTSGAKDPSGGKSSGGEVPEGLQKLFDAKSGGSSDGGLTPEAAKKWFKAAGFDVKDEELDKAIKKSSKGKKSLDFAAFKDCVENLAKEKKKEPKEWYGKLVAAK